ncbi:hypothetical protein [Methanobrevibacter sp.]
MSDFYFTSKVQVTGLEGERKENSPFVSRQTYNYMVYASDK